MNAHIPNELWQAQLGLALLRQRAKGSASEFSPYIELLPSVHHGVPIFFNGETLAMMQYPPLVEQARILLPSFLPSVPFSPSMHPLILTLSQRRIRFS